MLCIKKSTTYETEKSRKLLIVARINNDAKTSFQRSRGFLK